ncbi:outer membrane lipoprotein-sorting protein [Pyxidicoccus sp. MSG2]|uniref:outer membrane lipoprotein-sorting protein n=1 Tax=Pyxidicoccus sp. MSG2 TaxID=2996790 RepID=UPI00226D741D|nr:outer membrane lipoprotein-sorting protein [Pyxidicoccus sp. MSG2]MCY1021104.1 outer membrane lipoprotein-sorting protein [Pyxidicoccus sp. MSG2]
MRHLLLSPFRFLTWVLLCGMAAAAAPPPVHRPLNALALVKECNARDLGATGWRSVTLEMHTGGRVTRTLKIANLWQDTAGGLRTLFLLEGPGGLRGTSYLLTEPGPAGLPMQVHLYLPAGEGRVLEIAPRLHDDGLLGSDFGYRDLLWRLPEHAFTWTRAGESMALGRRTHLLDAVPSGPELVASLPWVRLRYHVAEELRMVVGIDYFRAGETAPAKTVRVEALEQRDGVWTPTRIVASRGGGSTSVLTLRGARFHLPALPARHFVPESLPGFAEALRGGTSEQLLTQTAEASP